MRVRPPRNGMSLEYDEINTRKNDGPHELRNANMKKWWYSYECVTATHDTPHHEVQAEGTA